LRPATTGELLDSGVALLRRSAGRILPVAFVLAALEQGLLYSLGRPSIASTSNPFVWLFRMFADHWSLLALGFGTEAMIIGILGGYGARAALPALLGQGFTEPRRIRFVAEVVLAALIGVIAAIAAFVLLVPVILVIVGFGLCVPALVVERTSVTDALGVGSRLAWSSGRARWIRLLAYVTWWLIRLAIGLATLAAFSYLLPRTGQGWLDLTSGFAWALANTIGYSMLGCVDAALYLETRFRLQGMDIALSRAIERGEPVEAILVRTHSGLPRQSGPTLEGPAR